MQHQPFLAVYPSIYKNELAWLQKRGISNITSGKSTLAKEMGLIPIRKLTDNIISDPNHKLKKLLPPVNDNLRYNLRRHRPFKIPTLFIKRTSEIYAMSK